MHAKGPLGERMTEWGFGFGEPYVDVDEWHETPLPHRYVHGGFADSHTRFSFYFPPKEQYKGRFFQFLEGGSGGNETLLTSPMAAAMGSDPFQLVFEELGGYLVESNQGHFTHEGTGFTSEVHLFGASSESARYAKTLAAQMYGDSPHHGYVWGASGGGVRAITCLENVADVWDGAVPTVCSVAGGVREIFSALASWYLHARDQRDQLVDATSPGGSGDPFSCLDAHGREALAMLYRMGYPRGAEPFLWPSVVLLWTMPDRDDKYNDDFWSRPGFAGHDDPGHMAELIVNRTVTVDSVLKLSDLPDTNLGVIMARATGAPDRNYSVTLRETIEDPDALWGATIRVVTGRAAGRELLLQGWDEGRVGVVAEFSPEMFDDVEVGDQLVIDNRRFVAFSYLYRHAVDLEGVLLHEANGDPTRLSPEFGGFRSLMLDGVPIYPQLDAASEPTVQQVKARFPGKKMIYVQATHDCLMCPNGAAKYHRLVRDNLGAATDDSFRLWWIQHGSHGPAEMLGPMLTPEKDPGQWRSRFANTGGAPAQALRDLVDWVEHGTEPPASTSYGFTGDGGLLLPESANARAGIQPVVELRANGGACAQVKVGETVSLQGRAEVPPAAGTLVWAEWDFAGTGAANESVDLGGTRVFQDLETVHNFDVPGTYFPVLRVGSHRHGSQGKGPAVENIARVRVVVTE